MAKSSGTLGTASRAFSGLGISSRLLARHGALRGATQQASEEPQQPCLPPLPGKGCPSPAPSWCSQRSPSRGRAALAGGRDRPAGSLALGASCLPFLSRLPALARPSRVSVPSDFFVLSGCLLLSTPLPLREPECSQTASALALTNTSAHAQESHNSSTSASRKEISGRLPLSPGHCTAWGENK